MFNIGDNDENFKVGTKVRIKNFEHIRFKQDFYLSHCGEETEITEVIVHEIGSIYGGSYHVKSNKHVWNGCELEILEDNISIDENELLEYFIN